VSSEPVQGRRFYGTVAANESVNVYLRGWCVQYTTVSEDGTRVFVIDQSFSLELITGMRMKMFATVYTKSTSISFGTIDNCLDGWPGQRVLEDEVDKLTPN
jgi:hypothetical protein